MLAPAPVDAAPRRPRVGLRSFLLACWVVLGLSGCLQRGGDPAEGFDARPDARADAGGPDGETRDEVGPGDLGEPDDLGASADGDRPTDLGVVDLAVDAAPPPDLGPPGRTVKVATFNVRRLFDTVCDSGRCGPDDFEYLPSRTDFLRKVEDVARGVVALDADVVMLQEVETQAALEAVVDLLRTLGEPYPVAVLGELGEAGSVDVAVLARGRLVRAVRHRDDADLRRPADGSRTSFAREFLEVEVDFEGDRVVAFSTHFRSKINDDPGRRQAEARAARDIVRARAGAQRDALVVLGGDLNDTPDSPPLRDLTEGGHLVRVAAELAPDDYTYDFNGQLDALDHLLVATEARGGAFVTGTAEVLRGRNGVGFAGSDHAAVRAAFFMPE